MIKSWKSEAARLILEGKDPGKGFPTALIPATRRRLFQLQTAEAVEDMRTPSGNRLHKLTGDREGQWSISVNSQFRICFRWSPEGPEAVEFVDCH